MSQVTARSEGRHMPGARFLETDAAAVVLLVALGAAYYLMPVTAVSLVLLVLFAWAIWLRTDLAVPLIPLAVPYYMLPKQLHLVRTVSFSLGETVLVLCVLVVLVQQLLTVGHRPGAVSVFRHFVPWSPFEGAAAAFLLASVLATVGAHFHTVALREFREVILEPIAFYWLLLQRARDAAGVARVVVAAALSGMVVAALGVGQLWLRPHDLVVAAFAPGKPHLVRAVYGNENNLALLLDRAIPIALALAIFPGWLFAIGVRVRPAVAGRAGGMLPTRLVRAAQAFLLAGSVLMGYIVYRTESRGGELAVALGVAVMVVYWQRRRPWLIAAAAAVVVMAAVVLRQKIWNEVVNGHGLTTDARVSVWQSALRMIRDHPLLGVGPDNFLYYYSNDAHCAPGHVAAYYYQQRNSQGVPVNFEPCLNHPHNLFLDLWLSTGILGLLAGIVLLALFVLLGLRAFMRAASPWKGPLLAALVAMLAYAVHGQVDNSYFLPDLAVYFWLCFGVVAIWYAVHEHQAAP